MRLSIFLLSLAGVLVLSYAALFGAPDPGGARRPVVVELFTSEGCSSCPPADALLQKLDQTQPIPGAFVIALSEHVDYWNHLGWKDPFSSADFSRRQEAYGRRFHLESVYTPQAVVDGAAEATGNDSRQIRAAIQQSIKSDKLDIQISDLVRNNVGVASVHIRVQGSGKPSGRSGERVMVALAENAVVSNVLRGENGGRKLDHVAVVRSITVLGHLDPARTFAGDFTLTGGLDQWAGKRLIAFVQDADYGPIQGAAMRLLPVALN